MEKEHAKLQWKPTITVTSERVAEVFGCGIEKADKILSQPENADLIRRCLEQALQAALFNAMYEMAKLPLVSVPIKRDCVVEISGVAMRTDVW